MTHTLLVNDDCTWKLFICGHEVKPITDGPLNAVPVTLNQESFINLISIIDQCKVCPGNPDTHFIELGNSRKGKFETSGGEIKARIEEGFPVTLKESVYTSTVRNTNCHILIHGEKCINCHKYRPQLRAMYSRYNQSKHKPHTVSSKYINNRFLKTPEKNEKLKNLQTKVCTVEKELKNLESKINKLNSMGISVDEPLHQDLLEITEQHSNSIMEKFPAGSFRRLFWEEQIKAAKVSDARQMRWHPMMIRWCLNLKLLSTSAYHSLRTSGFIKLPSERTLRDYTNFFQSKVGFQPEVDSMLLQEAQIDKLPDNKRYIVLLFDEMKICENLVYDKHHARVIGFVQIGEVNDELAQFEQTDNVNEHPPIAKHVLALMVRGVFSSLHFPYAHFATKDLNGADLFQIIWEAIERLEQLGFKVIALTGDGASCNRKFFKLHSNDEDEVCYKTINPYSDEKRYIYFISDVPYLMKTVRN